MENRYLDQAVKEKMLEKLKQLFGPLSDYQTDEVEKLLEQTTCEIVRQTKKACCDAINTGTVHPHTQIDKRVVRHMIQTCTVPFLK